MMSEGVSVRLIVPGIEARCPAGHPLRIPSESAAERPHYFCTECRKRYRLGDSAVLAAVRAAAVGLPVRSLREVEELARARRSERRRAARARLLRPLRRALAGPLALIARLRPRRTAAPARNPEAPGPVLAVSSRTFERLVSASTWTISAAVHGTLLLLLAIAGVAARIQQPPPEVVLTAAISPPEERKPFDAVRKRALFESHPVRENADQGVALPVVKDAAEPAVAAAPAEVTPTAVTEVPAVNDVPEAPLGMMFKSKSRGPAVLGAGSEAGGAERFGSGIPEGVALLVKSRATEESRLEAAKKGGGGEDTESAVEKALGWLAGHQGADGSWVLRPEKQKRKVIRKTEVGAVEVEIEVNISYGFPNDCTGLAATGMATLAFLGAGYSHRTGKYKDNVGRALAWLVDQQKADGCWSDKSQFQEMHAQGIATLALVEGYMAAPPGREFDTMLGRERLRAAAQTGIEFIERAQYPYSAWGYTPLRTRTAGGAAFFAPGVVEQSVVIWNGMALKAARTAGLRVDGKAFAGIARWLDDGQGLGGQYAYSGTYTKGRTVCQMKTSTPCMNAAALMMRFWTGTQPGQQETDKTADIILGGLNPPAAKAGDPYAGWHTKDDLYFLHHGTIALFQFGGERWKQWNATMKPKVLGLQNADGSWTAKTQWDGYVLGDAAKTALGALILESYYRYSPLYR